MTITIHSETSDLKIQRLIDFTKQLGLTFTISDETLDNDILAERKAVQKAIEMKYVQNNSWENLSDDQKQDIVLAETMLYRQLNQKRETLTADETEDFLNQLTEGNYGH